MKPCIRGVCIAFLYAGALAAGTPQVDSVADLLSMFDPARVRDALSCEVRRPAAAGGVHEDALFEHPIAPGRPARIDYELDLPPASETEPLLLTFDIALADGIKPGTGEDGVRFLVEVSGQRVYSGETKETRWQSQAVDLTPFAGRHARLTLVTDGLKNTSYDWALWGRPRILKFPKTDGDADPKQPATANLMNGPIGALAVRTVVPVKLRLIPDSDEPPVEIALGNPAIPAQWLVRDFSFTRAATVRVETDPGGGGAPVELHAGVFAPALELTRVSATRAVIQTGDAVPIAVAVRNRGPGTLADGQGRIRLRLGVRDLPEQRIPRLGPGETWGTNWTWRAPDRPGAVEGRSELSGAGVTEHATFRLEICAPPKPGRDVLLENGSLGLEFVRQPDGFSHARILARQGGRWTEAAVWRPLFGIVAETHAGPQPVVIRARKPREASGSRGSVEFVETARDADGVEWQVLLRVRLETHRPAAQVHYEWRPARARRVRQLTGPNLYVGDGTTGAAKSGGLFPGLEYLYGAEPSSNPRDFAPNLADRRTPHPNMVTIPLMAVTVGPDSESPSPREAADRFYTPDSLKDRLTGPEAGPFPGRGAQAAAPVTVALTWDPLQKWDGQHAFPSARFASPNFDEGMANHRLALFLPASPEFAKPNGDGDYEIAAGKALTLDATIYVEPGPLLKALRDYLDESGGLPAPHPWPRSFQGELDVCRAGLLKTLWDEKTQRWSHCIGWAAGHAPGFAALLWLDSQLAEDPAARGRSRDRVELAVQNMMREGGPALFTSRANCHILQWEFPFLYGCLPEALSGLDAQVRQLIDSQRPAGGWLYEPAGAEQARLGRAGDSVLGTCANRAATLLRYARITGDRAALESGEKALHFMEQFRVPRGGQTWECPMYEPDILAAAYAVRAYHDGYRATGNPRWLHDAVYWAETGVPFVYLWSLPDKPMMLGATIPVFGSTFYTHTWLAVPVQWCGLVYAYHVFHLARELERTPLPSTDSPLPLALGFSPADWRRVVELITVSGMYQQFGEGDRVGAYPDSISRFERRNPAFINPEDILLNVLALQGTDPDVQTARTRAPEGGIVVSSGAKIEDLQATAEGATFRLESFAGQASHCLVSGLEPKGVMVNGRPLPRSAEPVRREPGWWWDEAHRRAYLVVPPEGTKVQVEISKTR